MEFRDLFYWPNMQGKNNTSKNEKLRELYFIYSGSKARV